MLEHAGKPSGESGEGTSWRSVLPSPNGCGALYATPVFCCCQGNYSAAIIRVNSSLAKSKSALTNGFQGTNTGPLPSRRSSTLNGCVKAASMPVGCRTVIHQRAETGGNRQAAGTQSGRPSHPLACGSVMGAIDPRYPPLPRPVTIENLTDEELAALTRAQIDRLGTPHEGPCDWRFWARDEQMAPSGDWAKRYLAGRGAGKTRAGDRDRGARLPPDGCGATRGAGG